MTDQPETLRAVLTVTVETKPGDYYYDHDDFVRHVVPWIEGGLDDRDDIRTVTITEQPAVPPPATDHTTPSRRAGLRDALRRAICEAEGFTWDSDMLEPDEYGDHADAVLAVLYREWPWLRAEAEDAATDHTTLRDRIAEALYDHNHPGWATRYADLDQDQQDTYTARADAVLAVLPATTNPAAVCICGHPPRHHFEDVCLACDCGDYLEPGAAREVIARMLEAATQKTTDQAVVLSAAERTMLTYALDLAQDQIHSRGDEFTDDDQAAVDSLRRTADETQPPASGSTTEPAQDQTS